VANGVNRTPVQYQEVGNSKSNAQARGLRSAADRGSNSSHAIPSPDNSDGRYQHSTQDVQDSTSGPTRSPSIPDLAATYPS